MKKKTAIIISALVLVAIAVTVVYTTIVVPKQNYEKAEELFAAENYSIAYDVYIKLGDYKDSAGKSKECLYQQAVAYRDVKNWDAANPLFEQIKDYKDSATLIHYHNHKVIESVEATCLTSGYKELKCDCGEECTETVAALGHNYSAATCTEAKTCSRCGKTEGAALGHVIGEITCSRCGKCTFETLTYSGKGDKILKDIVLPEGDFVIKVEATLAASEYSDLIFVHAYYANGNKAAYLSGHPSGKNGRKDSDQTTFEGPMAGGRIEIETENSISWELTIEAL